MNSSELLALLQADDLATGTIPKRVSAGPAPLSFAQQRLWFLQRYQPQATAYNLTRAFRLHGELDADALECAFGLLIARHEILRTRFEEHEGEPRQVVLAPAPFALRRDDLAALTEPQRRDAVMRHIEAEAGRPFDLGAAPLLRASLLRTAATEQVLVIAMHHIVSDAWSNPVLSRDLSAAYQAALAGSREPVGPALPVQYADYASWQCEQWRSGAFAPALRQAQDLLSGDLPVLSLPTDKPRPQQQSFRGARLQHVLPAEVGLALRAFCRSEGCTPYAVLLAAWQVLLARYSGQADFAIGVPNAARLRPELDALVGFFVNTQVVRARITPDLDTRGLCRRLRQDARDMLNQAELPFELMLQRLPLARDTSHSPVFQVMFNLQTADRPVGLSLAGLRAEAIAVECRSAKFDLTLDAAIVGGELRFDLEYCTGLFEPATAQRIARHYATLLTAMLAQPGQRLSRLPMLDAGERRCLLHGWNQTARDPAPDDDLVARFERQALQTPERVAVVFGEIALGYRELNDRANRLAHWLIAHGVQSERLVAVCLDREPDLLVALLAILKAGGAYLPIDAAQPAARNALILAHAAPHLVLDSLDAALAGGNDENPSQRVMPHRLAYVLYTSGSTGQPKGVAVTRGAFANFLRAIQAEARLTPDDCLLAVTTLGFDIAGLEFFLPLVEGARVVIASREQAMHPQALLSLMRAHRVTVMQATPATWQMLVEHDSPAWQGLSVLCGGEALRADLAQRLLARGARVLNLYGPTETTVWSSAWGVTAADPARDAVLPLGRPIANNRLFILDAALEPVPPGVTGELCIGGLGLARGYLHRAGLTAAAFVPNPFTDDGAPGAEAGSRLYRTGDLARRRADGVIEFIGRRDGQVKLRGFRVELGEVEVALAAHPAVRQAVATVHPAPGGQPVLVGYCVPGEGTLDAGALEAWLRDRLPAYMVPSRFVALEVLPLNANGKLDRRALPPPDWQPAPGEPPATDTERRLAEIWRSVLGVAEVARDDDIFLLGAQSLQLVRVLASVRQAFACEPSLAGLFGAPRLREMAACIDTARAQAQPDPLAGFDELLDALERESA